MQACFNTHHKTKNDIPSIEFVKRRVRARYEFRHRIEEVISPRYGAEWVDELVEIRQSDIEGANLGAFAKRCLVQGKLLGIYEAGSSARNRLSAELGGAKATSWRQPLNQAIRLTTLMVGTS